MSSRNTVVSCRKLSGLQVRGFYSNKTISLPVTYSRDFIPANRDHIPSPTTAKAWPHLQCIASEIAPLQSCDVGLLIGYNCPQALVPREVVSGRENQPFAQRTDLGWSIVGYGNPCLDYGDAFGISHQVIVKEVVPDIQPSSNFTNKVHYVYRTQIKEIISPTELSAAVVAVRTGDMLKKELEMEISEERYWTDSKVVLGYLSNEARRFHVFVANRVERIKQSTESTQWRYVTSEDNLADHASRGLTAEQLVASNWFKGRLTHAALHPNVKHPAILPRDSHVSTLLVKHYHEKTYHQGRGITMNELRANGFWILGCSKIVSSYIYKCVKCRRFRRRTEQQKMADLPEDWMETTPPFTYCGMNCFGPFYVKEGRKEPKGYGLLITLLRENPKQKAVHLEMLDNLSTNSLINSLRAFMAIRGTVRQIRCDQGTRNEFIGAFKEMDQAKLGKLDCEFLMNTPASSHMGGVWERQIRTIRSVLMSILEQSAKQLMSSLRTFLYEVMAVINSRPLTTDHSTIISPPPGRFVKEDLYLRKRWRRVQLLANTFWTRWKKEYLLNLQGRQKWTKEHRNAKINDVVLLKDEITPRNQWKLARIIEVYPGKDGKVRKVKLLLSDPTLDRAGKRTSKPVHLERPTQKTVILMEPEEDSPPHSA
ncbi:Rho-associated protein kinase 2 [Sarotherodon galilaeus]